MSTRKPEPAKFPCQIHAPELIPGSCSGGCCGGPILMVKKDVNPSTFDITKLRPRSPLICGDRGWVNSKTLRQRAIRLGANLGLSDGKRLLAEQESIPVEFRGFNIPLPGTILCDSEGNCYSPRLYWQEESSCWKISFPIMDIGGSDDDRLACIEAAA